LLLLHLTILLRGPTPGTINGAVRFQRQAALLNSSAYFARHITFDPIKGPKGAGMTLRRVHPPILTFVRMGYAT